MNPNALNFRTTKNLTQSLKNSKEEKIKDVINELTYLDCKLEQFRLSAYNPNWTEIGGLEDLLRCSSKLSLSNKFGVTVLDSVNKYNFEVFPRFSAFPWMALPPKSYFC